MRIKGRRIRAALASRGVVLHRTRHLRKGHVVQEHEEGLARVIPSRMRAHILSPGASTAIEKGYAGPVRVFEDVVDAGRYLK